jgi:hypothetical protein
MRKKKAHSKRKNPLQIRIKRLVIPKGVKPSEYFDTLLRAVETKHLPDGWSIELGWRNPETKKGRSRDWQSGEFAEVLRSSASRGGFATVVYRTIRRAQAAQEQQPLPKARATRKEFLRRSRAAKKGWVTRRKHMKEAAAVARKKAKKRS